MELPLIALPPNQSEHHVDHQPLHDKDGVGVGLDSHPLLSRVKFWQNSSGLKAKKT